MSSSSLRGCKQIASQKAPTLRRSKSSLFRQSSLSQSANSISRERNSASHSSRQSARKRRGTITPMTRISHRYGLLQRSNISVMAKRDQRINSRRPSRGQIAGQQRHHHEQQGNGHKRR